jgi:potassium-transporting ATPase ATP-binding subunit
MHIADIADWCSVEFKRGYSKVRSPSLTVKRRQVFFAEGRRYFPPLLITLLSLLSVLQVGQSQDSSLILLNACVWLTFLSFSFLENGFEASAKKQLRQISHVNSAPYITTVANGRATKILPGNLRSGERVFVKSGEIIPADGLVVEGLSAVDESAITGESAPVIREPSETRKFVTAGSRVLTGHLVIEVTQGPGSRFIDGLLQLIAIRPQINRERHTRAARVFFFLYLVASALLFAFVITVGTERNIYWNMVFSLSAALAAVPFWHFSSSLALTTVGFVKHALQMNYVPKSISILERAASINVLVLDKTGTITVGDRKATAFIPLPGVEEKELAKIAQLASLADETPEGRSIVVLVKEVFGLRAELLSENVEPISFSSETQVSGLHTLDSEGRRLQTILKGSPSAIKRHLESLGAEYPHAAEQISRTIAETGASPLLVCSGSHILGAVSLSDRVRGGLKEQLAKLRLVGIKEIMLTGDDPITSETIGKLVDINVRAAVASPKRKLEIVRYLQDHGSCVLMIGDDANDAPAMAQADLSIAMNTGDHIVREVSGIVDLQSNPVRVGKLIFLAKRYRALRTAVILIFSLIMLFNAVFLLSQLFRLEAGFQFLPVDFSTIKSPLFLISIFLIAELAYYLLVLTLQRHILNREVKA